MMSRGPAPAPPAPGIGLLVRETLAGIAPGNRQVVGRGKKPAVVGKRLASTVTRLGMAMFTTVAVLLYRAVSRTEPSREL